MAAIQVVWFCPVAQTPEGPEPVVAEYPFGHVNDGANTCARLQLVKREARRE